MQIFVCQRQVAFLAHDIGLAQSVSNLEIGQILALLGRQSRFVLQVVNLDFELGILA